MYGSVIVEKKKKSRRKERFLCFDFALLQIYERIYRSTQTTEVGDREIMHKEVKHGDEI